MTNKKLLNVMIILVLLAAAASATEWKSAEAGGFSLSWAVDGENLMVKVSAETEGYVAVGFDPSNKMKDANIIIGYVDDGEVVIADHYGNGVFSHRDDERLGGTNDIVDGTGTEVDGVTELSFTIPLDSGDSADRALIPGNSYKVIFASHRRDRITSKHNSRTSTTITL